MPFDLGSIEALAIALAAADGNVESLNVESGIVSLGIIDPAIDVPGVVFIRDENPVNAGQNRCQW